MTRHESAELLEHDQNAAGRYVQDCLVVGDRGSLAAAFQAGIACERQRLADIANCRCNIGAQECPVHTQRRLRTPDEKREFSRAWDLKVEAGWARQKAQQESVPVVTD